MTGTSQKTPTQRAVGSVRTSGFPFQMAVRRIVDGTPSWQVDKSEFPFVDWDGRDRFVDLVARSGNDWRAVIECKRASQETLTFLLDTEFVDADKRLDFVCVNTFVIPADKPRLGRNVMRANLYPLTFESEFCVTTRQSNATKKGRTLEPECQTLVRAADAVSLDLIKQFNASPSPATDPHPMVIPVLVTAAEIFVAEVKPSAVDLDSGDLDFTESELKAVDHVRFSKAFTAREHDSDERGVFVVRASKLEDFLRELRVAGGNREAMQELHKMDGNA